MNPVKAINRLWRLQIEVTLQNLFGILVKAFQQIRHRNAVVTFHKLPLGMQELMCEFIGSWNHFHNFFWRLGHPRRGGKPEFKLGRFPPSYEPACSLHRAS
jgi:hypothetical protein